MATPVTNKIDPKNPPRPAAQGNGAKYDSGKAPLSRGVIAYFPRALKAVAEISDYGFKKYGAWDGWRDVEDGRKRYSDAMSRHIVDEAIDGEFDPESKLRHAAHAAWNALARLELALIEEAKAPKAVQLAPRLSCSQCGAKWEPSTPPEARHHSHWCPNK